MRGRWGYEVITKHAHGLRCANKHLNKYARRDLVTVRVRVCVCLCRASAQAAHDTTRHGADKWTNDCGNPSHHSHFPAAAAAREYFLLVAHVLLTHTSRPVSHAKRQFLAKNAHASANNKRLIRLRAQRNKKNVSRAVDHYVVCCFAWDRIAHIPCNLDLFAACTNRSRPGIYIRSFVVHGRDNHFNSVFSVCVCAALL